MVDERQNQRLSTVPEKATEPWHFLIVLLAVWSRTDRKGRFELAVEEMFYRRFECLSARQQV
jgi:hypothetical protein